MSGLRAALFLDVRLQARNRLYHIGLVVALLTGIAARFFFTESAIGRVLCVYYLAGIGGTTYMFGASMVLFEKSERTVEALRVTPLPARSYLASKALTLSAFAVLESLVVVLVAGRGTLLSPWPLATGALALGVLYTLLGIGQVAPEESVTSFIFPGALVVSLVLSLPFLYLLDVRPGVLYLVPTQAPLLLMLGAFERQSPGTWLYAAIGSVVWGWCAYAFARARLRRHLRLERS